MKRQSTASPAPAPARQRRRTALSEDSKIGGDQITLNQLQQRNYDQQQEESGLSSSSRREVQDNRNADQADALGLLPHAFTGLTQQVGQHGNDMAALLAASRLPMPMVSDPAFAVPSNLANHMLGRSPSGHTSTQSDVWLQFLQSQQDHSMYMNQSQLLDTLRVQPALFPTHRALSLAQSYSQPLPGSGAHAQAQLQPHLQPQSQYLQDRATAHILDHFIARRFAAALSVPAPHMAVPISQHSINSSLDPRLLAALAASSNALDIQAQQIQNLEAIPATTGVESIPSSGLLSLIAMNHPDLLAAMQSASLPSSTAAASSSASLPAGVSLASRGFPSSLFAGSPEGDAPSETRTDPPRQPDRDYSSRRLTAMAVKSDRHTLSEYQALVREQIYIFQAVVDDIESSAQGRNKPIRLGQVGIICKHCATLPPGRRPRGSVYFPAKLKGLYQAAQNMTINHFQESCANIPADVKEKLLALKEKKTIVHGGGKHYWANTARLLGVQETEDGLEYSTVPPRPPAR